MKTASAYRYRHIIGLFAFGLWATSALATPQAKLSTQLQTAVSEARRRIEPAGNGGYAAQNPEQRLTVGFDGQGLQLAPATKDPNWHWGLNLQGYGVPGRIAPVQKAEAVNQGRRLEYRRGNITEWYENRPEGLEQGFTLAQPPWPDAGVVELRLGLSGNLTPKLDPDGRGARLRDHSGRDTLAYRKLDVIDAQGKHLPARLTLAGSGFAIWVDATNAVWPVVVDPFVASFEAKLEGSDSGNHDFFGNAVALSGDGKTALVGAYQNDNHNKSVAGAAYVFVRDGMNWSFQQKLESYPDGGNHDQFGWSVALSSDGKLALVGAPSNDNHGRDINGAAYVFVHDDTGWSRQAKLESYPDGASGDQFGWSVALSSDGNFALVGAPSNENHGRARNGAAYVFAHDGTRWNQQAKLESYPYGGDDDEFGLSVALSESGDTAVVGAPDTRNNQGELKFRGAAYVFFRSGSAWTRQAKLDADSDGNAYEDLGTSVALSGDTALIGAPAASGGQDGSFYVFVYNGAAWVRDTKVTVDGGNQIQSFGRSVALSADGYTSLVGANDANAAYVFTRSDTGWEQQAVLEEGDDYDTFGSSVALSGDGNTALVGSPKNSNRGHTKSGAAYVYGLVDTFSLAVANSGGGKVVSQPAGIDCGTVCTASFPAKREVTLTLTPDAGYRVAGTAGCEGTAPSSCWVSMYSDRHVEIRFEKIQPTLTVSGIGGNPITAGRITSSPAGIDCGDGSKACSAAFPSGYLVRLTAVPDSGYAVTSSSWRGCDRTSADSTTCEVGMFQDNSVSILFYPSNACSAAAGVSSGFTAQACVKFAVRTRGRGWVSAADAGIICGEGNKSCAARFPRGQAITLTAHPVDGHSFKRWINGGCTGTGPCTVTLDRAKTVKAVFAPSKP